MVIDPALYGVSFSIKQCRNFQIEPEATLQWLLDSAGFRRFRLMSYWDEHEKQPGVYDFAALDKQIEIVSKAGGVISLCLGARQPRWPENHWPAWAWQTNKSTRSAALLKFIEVVVERYKYEPAVISYQLENEALLKAFGQRPEVDRSRLRQEYALIKRLDSTRPIIMSTSTSWGIPMRRPIPDVIGFSYYQIVYNANQKHYTTAFHTPLLHRARAALIRLLHHKSVFIHELQLEPWGPTAIWKMPPAQQDESMGPEQIRKNLALAQAVKHYPIDLWGAEWWYWRQHVQSDASIWETVAGALAPKP